MVFFRDEVEAVDCALQCIYMSTETDRWSTMAAIFSKLPQIQGCCFGSGIYGDEGNEPLWKFYFSSSSRLARRCTSKPFNGVLQQEKLQLDQNFLGCLQLGYNVIFGSYASFLLIRTGHLLAP
ncbi:uncharacterized protein LOC132186098 isoform X2 [Corylus avellana]|uniref:uncharacterized protein LOC132186098 isoform X2 n=1 Tax=Corylus avellana TaxID=13451 RepID=UPI00286A1C7F|nr:uncharacterized protein LOC132186098 isoform X2 [Corylus avellana]